MKRLVSIGPIGSRRSAGAAASTCVGVVGAMRRHSSNHPLVSRVGRSAVIGFIASPLLTPGIQARFCSSTSGGPAGTPPSPPSNPKGNESKTEDNKSEQSCAPTPPSPAETVSPSVGGNSTENEKMQNGDDASSPPKPDGAKSEGPGDRPGAGDGEPAPSEQDASAPNSAGIPKGFERFFDKRFPRATDVKSPPEGEVPPLSQAEVHLINELSKRMESRRRRNRTLMFIGCGLGVLFWRSFDLRALKVAIGFEEPPSLDDAEFVIADADSHHATFFDSAARILGTASFIDLSAFERTLAAMTADPNLLVRVPTEFPLAAIGFLWLLPVLAVVYRGLQAGISAGRLQSKGTGGGLHGPAGGHKFRFKLDHDVKTRLGDVAGLTEVKGEIVEIIDFLKNPGRYRDLGARLPKGVLLDGPPGVGKTLLAKAVAGEAMVPFVSCSGSEFEEVYVGVGAQRVRQLFKKAREERPCVIFIDEIDTFGRKRRNDRGKNSRGTINALLSELDGFKDATGVIVLAATNRADILDEALTRSGRFDRKISIDKPPHKDRANIAKVHLKPLKLDPSLTVDGIAEMLASMTPGCTGADIHNVCNEAAIAASRNAKPHVDLACFHYALDRILVGMEKKARRLQERERERLAFHEAGHVVLAWFQENVDPVLKATIVPRGGHTTGVTKTLPKERFITTQAVMREQMVQRLGGYVAEEHFFNDLSTSAADDLARVTEMATNELTVYGMDPAAVGHFGFEYNSNAVQKPYGPAKANVIDKKVKMISGESLTTARKLLQQHLESVRIVAGMLMKDETVTARQLWTVLGERPKMTPEFRKYLEEAST